MRVDLHVHTCYSYDSSLSLLAIVACAERRGLDGVAVLDHDGIVGALELQGIAPFKVIVGEEIGTADGGIAALFISEPVPPRLSAEATIACVREQGGLVMVPHPFARAVPGRIKPATLLSIVSDVDVVEGYNARTFFAADDRKGREFAARYRIPVSAGSDAHFACEVGRAWSEVDDFNTAPEFVAALRRSWRHHCRKTCPLLPAATVDSIPFRSLLALVQRRRG